ncbi:hypothetical protein AB0O42_24540 [Streptomyces sp. NPDC089922]|uniref:hypothetical protein n=1 Tax=unclassified Streptomyces TaxID=2593676 RepID=UPI00343A30A2
MSVKKISVALAPATALLVMLGPAEAFAATPQAAVPEKVCSMSHALPLPDLLPETLLRPAVRPLPKPVCVNGWQ